MPESIMRKVDGNGQTREILGNGGSYTARVLDVDGSVVASQDVGTMNEAIAILETLQAPEPVAEEVAEEPKHQSLWPKRWQKRPRVQAPEPVAEEVAEVAEATE
jgi:hypothetical protein